MAGMIFPTIRILKTSNIKFVLTSNGTISALNSLVIAMRISIIKSLCVLWKKVADVMSFLGPENAKVM